MRVRARFARSRAITRCSRSGRPRARRPHRRPGDLDSYEELTRMNPTMTLSDARAALVASVEMEPASMYWRCSGCGALVQRQHTEVHVMFHAALAAVALEVSR